MHSALYGPRFIKPAALLGMVLLLALSSRLAVADERGRDVLNEPIYPGGPTHRALVEQFFAERVFPREAAYEGVNVTRDHVNVERLETNGRGGYWITVTARYGGRRNETDSVAASARIVCENGDIRYDLGGLRGAVDTGPIGLWIADRLPKGDPPARPGAAGRRRVFAYTAGEFHKLQGRRWVERRFEGPDSHFIETARTPEFVELYDRDRDLLVRLRDDHGEWLVRDTSSWVPWPGSEGRWK